MENFKVAAVQAAPVFMDRDATVEKACELMREAAANGAKLVVFPETFIPTYPFWVWAVPAKENRLLSELYAELLDQAVTIPGPAISRLAEGARKAGIHAVVGLNERNSEASGASLYNTLLYLGPDGRILGKHRKLVPTAPERMVWAQGQGEYLEVFDTPLGKLSGLICWENYMPLARYALYAWGVQLYAAPTWDHGEPWLSTLRHVAKEGRMYVIGCCSAIRRADVPDTYEFKKYYPEGSDWINKGDSAIVDPDGKFIGGPLNSEEGIVYADVNPSQFRGPKWKLDVAGHYSRPDVFRLIVNRSSQPVLLESEVDPVDLDTVT
ncbi:MAG: carbon-nitrogen hydrolase family protein [Trueperaceae bacterium]